MKPWKQCNISWMVNVGGLRLTSSKLVSRMGHQSKTQDGSWSAPQDPFFAGFALEQKESGTSESRVKLVKLVKQVCIRMYQLGWPQTRIDQDQYCKTVSKLLYSCTMLYVLVLRSWRLEDRKHIHKCAPCSFFSGQQIAAFPRVGYGRSTLHHLNRNLDRVASEVNRLLEERPVMHQHLKDVIRKKHNRHHQHSTTMYHHYHQQHSQRKFRSSNFRLYWKLPVALAASMFDSRDVLAGRNCAKCCVFP